MVLVVVVVVVVVAVVVVVVAVAVAVAVAVVVDDKKENQQMKPPSTWQFFVAGHVGMMKS